jgi:hypothetical protein
MAVREKGQTQSGRPQRVAFPRPKPGPERRHSRAVGRQRPRDPAETDWLAEETGFELSVPRGGDGCMAPVRPLQDKDAG